MKTKILCICLVLFSLLNLTFAERYEKHEVYDTSFGEKESQKSASKAPVEEVKRIEDIELPLVRYGAGEFYDDFGRLVAKNIRKEAKILWEEQASSKKVSEISEIEFPLRRISYAEFRDDFDRVIADEIRKDAKKLYEEQEAEKEVTKIEDIELPITKSYSDGKIYSSKKYDDYYYGYSNCCGYSGDGETQKVVFYDGLGRRISDSLARDAKKMYEKQLRSEEWASWRSVNLSGFWHGFWGLIKTVIYIVVIVFAGTFVLRKIKDGKEKPPVTQK